MWKLTKTIKGLKLTIATFTTYQHAFLVWLDYTNRGVQVELVKISG